MISTVEWIYEYCVGKEPEEYDSNIDKRYINNQRYSECQLVTAINAAICLNEHPINPHSVEYERLVDLSMSRHGAVIEIEEVYRYLRICKLELRHTWKNIKYRLEKHPNKEPIEFYVYNNHNKKTGYHSVLAIECKEGRKYKYIRIANFIKHTKDGWIKWDEFKKFLRPGCWYFFLDPWYIRELQRKNIQNFEK